jgi:hypothetical protein
MPNQRHSRDNMVPNGTAPLECFPQMKKFRKKHVPNTRAGYSVAVCNHNKLNIFNNISHLHFFLSAAGHVSYGILLHTAPTYS